MNVPLQPRVTTIELLMFPGEIIPLLMIVLPQFNWNKQRFGTKGNTIKRSLSLFK
jgi:hypothetical protein